MRSAVAGTVVLAQTLSSGRSMKAAPIFLEKSRVSASEMIMRETCARDRTR